MLNLPNIMGDEDFSLESLKATKRNAQAFFYLVQSKADSLDKNFFGLSQEIYDEERALRYLEQMQHMRHLGKMCYFIKKSGQIIGEIDCLEEGPKGAVIDYWIDKNFRRQHLTSTALRLVEKHVFETGQYDFIALNIDPMNVASVGLALKNGYRSTTAMDAFIFCFEKTV